MERNKLSKYSVRDMKNVFYSLLIAVVLSLHLGCEEEMEGPLTWDSEPITSYEIEPIYGGAVVRYDVPNDENLLYVMVEYERNGEMFTEKASLYTNELRIEGFNHQNEVTAQLFKVNKEGAKSQPLQIKFTPMEPVISLAVKSLTMDFTFGGVLATWENITSTSLGVHLLSVDSVTQDLETSEVYFSTVKSDSYAFRGFEPKQSTFGIYFEDQWGNTSDTTYLEGTPLYETAIEKPYGDFRAQIPYDNATNLSSTYLFENIWDNIVNTSRNGWLTVSGSSGLSMTIDLGKPVKLSRIVIHGYHINSPYGQVNITNWEGWATREIDFDLLDDKDYWLDEESVRIGAIHDVPVDYTLPDRTFKDDWQYLGYHEITRYDLLTPPDPQGVLNLSENGMEYIMPLENEPVRYIRLFAREVAGVKPPPNTNYFSMGEITVYGDDTVP